MDLQAESQIRETLRGLDSDSERGLPQHVVRERLRVRARSTQPFMFRASHLPRPMRSPVIMAQLIAALTFTVAGRYVEAGAVALAMAVTLVARDRAFYRSHRRSRSVTCGSISVIRDGCLAVVPGTGLVPGDVVRLGVGDIVPADGRIIEAINLTVEQATMTGEHAPVRKWALELDDPSRGVSDRPSAVFAGSRVIAGHGSFVVCDGVDSTAPNGEPPGEPGGGQTMHRVLGTLRSLERYLAAMAGVSSLTCLVMGWWGNEGGDPSLVAVAGVAVAWAVPLPALVSFALTRAHGSSGHVCPRPAQDRTTGRRHSDLHR